MKAKPKGKHFKFAVVCGQIVGALYFIPWPSIVGPETAHTWAPFFASEQVQGLIFAIVSWIVVEIWELFK